MSRHGARLIFALTALLAFTGNALSLYLGSQRGTEPPYGAGFSGGFDAGWEHLLNQPTYFTFLSNFLVGLTSLLLAIRPHRTSDLFHALRIAAVTCIVITGVVFNLLLRSGPMATPIDLASDTIQHIITPVLTPVAWLLLDPRGHVTWKRILLAAIIPLGWLAFTLARGPVIDWYPYTILDVARLGYAGVAVNMGAVLVLYVAIATLMWLIDRARLRRSTAVSRLAP